MTWFLPIRGRTAARCAKPASKVISPNRSWKNTADIPIVRDRPGDRGRDRHAVDAAARRQRRVGDDDDVGGARLLELAHDQRAEVGERRLRPVDRRQPVAGLPVAQADEVEAVAVEQAAVLADRELAHPPQDQQLDFGELRQVDQRRSSISALRSPVRRRGQDLHGNRHPLEDVLDHGVHGQAVAGRVRPEPDAVAEDVDGARS